MKLLILSDSHGRADLIERLYALHPDAYCIIHLGDGAEEAIRFQKKHPSLPFYLLNGNCDWFSRGGKDELLLTLDGVKILACHGHRYDVKRSLLTIQMKALSEGAAVALFGHTHRPYLDETDGLTLLNPGSIGESPDGFFRYAVATIENGQFHAINTYFQ